MMDKSQAVYYINWHIDEFVMSINRLAGFNVDSADVSRFLSGHQVNIDISSAKAIISTDMALRYILDKAMNPTDTDTVYVDNINKILSFDHGSEFGSSLRDNAICASGRTKRFEVCTKRQLSDIIYYSSVSRDRRGVVDVVVEMLRALPYKSANTRTALLTLDLLLLQKDGSFLDSRAVDQKKFIRLVDEAKTINGDGYNLTTLLLGNIM